MRFNIHMNIFISFSILVTRFIRLVTLEIRVRCVLCSSACLSEWVSEWRKECLQQVHGQEYIIKTLTAKECEEETYMNSSLHSQQMETKMCMKNYRKESIWCEMIWNSWNQEFNIFKQATTKKIPLHSVSVWKTFQRRKFHQAYLSMLERSSILTKKF